MSKMIILLIVGICLLTDLAMISAASTNTLIESDHPYANNVDSTWPPITQSSATQIRLHFSKLELATDTVYGDKLILSDEEGQELKTYTHYDTKDDFWTDWYTGNTINVKLTTNGYNTAYGFKIDKVDQRQNMSILSAFPESYHPYANNFEYAWLPITQSGATRIRLHFSKLELATDTVYGDKLILSDKDGTELITYTHYDTKDGFWTDWYTGDTIIVKLTTNGYNTAYGFKIDNVDPGTSPTYTPNENPVSDTTTPETPVASLSSTTPETPVANLSSTTPETPSPNLFSTTPEQPSPEPQASFTSVRSGYVHLGVVFTDTSTETPTSWYWDFGDGNTSTAQNPTHIYEEAGRYTVTLTVTNDAGSNKISKDFQVLAVANEQPQTTSTQISEPTLTVQPQTTVTVETNPHSSGDKNIDPSISSAVTPTVQKEETSLLEIPIVYTVVGGIIVVVIWEIIKPR